MAAEIPESTDCKEEAIAISEVNIGVALCEALRDLANEQGLVTPDGLRKGADLEDSVIEALEGRVGPGPWPLEKLEDLLGQLFAVGSHAAKEEHVSHWWASELQELADVVEDALRAEDSGASDALEEPESEHPREAEALEAGIMRLQQAVAVRAATPTLESARHTLAAFADDVLPLLRKTWRLACIRGHRVQQSVTRQTSSRESLAAKRATKERDWELADARRKIEQLEQERWGQEQRLRQLETASRRELQARSEAERRLLEVQSEGAEAAEQEQQLRQRTAEAEAAMRGAQQELEMLQAACWEQRAGELTLELHDSQRAMEELQRQLRGQLQPQPKEVHSCEPQGQRTRTLQRTLEVVQEEVPVGGELHDSAQCQAPLEQRHQRGWKPPMRRSASGGSTGSGPGAVAAAAAEHVPHIRRSASDRSTGSGHGSIAAASATVPRLRGMPATSEAGGGSAPGSLGRPSKNINSLPMDLRGLGKLLTGGGVTPRHR